MVLSQLTDGKKNGYLVKGTLLLTILVSQSCTLFSGSTSKYTKQVRELSFEKTELAHDLSVLTKEPHPFGSKRQKDLSTWIKQKSRRLGLLSRIQHFQASTPNPIIFQNKNAPADQVLKKNGYNVLATLPGSKKCEILIGSHYDTKVLEQGLYLGANDSASSSAALFHIASFIKKLIPDDKKRCLTTFIWFDGEEPILPDWQDGEKNYPIKIKDNTYGSRHFVNTLNKCQNGYCQKKSSTPITAFILLDMIGSESLKISLDLNSDLRLREMLLKGAESLGLRENISLTFQEIEDDHIPFREKGIPAIDIIDFHNLHHWHKPSDTISKVSHASIEKASKLAVYVYLSLTSENL